MAMDDMTKFVKDFGSEMARKRALRMQLPGTPWYDILEGRVPSPAHTYTRLVEMSERWEASHIRKEIESRRTRIGARLEMVTLEVKREVFEKSDLSELYQGVIDWTSSDDERVTMEEKKFRRAFEYLEVASREKKASIQKEVAEMARGMVAIQRPLQLAWEVHIEWQDVGTIKAYDVSMLRQYIQLFPEAGLANVLQAYLTSPICPLLTPGGEFDSDSDENLDGVSGGVSLVTPEDRIALIMDGLKIANNSILAHRLAVDYYLSIDEYDNVVEISRVGAKKCNAASRSTGLTFQNSLDAINTSLATALIKYQSPRNHPEARSLFEGILKRKPHDSRSLIGIGLILQEEESYGDDLRSQLLYIVIHIWQTIKALFQFLNSSCHVTCLCSCPGSFCCNEGEDRK